MSAFCSCETCATCVAARAKRCEIRDGRRYENGVDVGPAQPDLPDSRRQYARKGGRGFEGRAEDKAMTPDSHNAAGVILEAFPPPDVMIDRRAFAADKHRDGGFRQWKKITGVCLHQTACDMGERPDRYDTLGAHFAVLRSGRVVWVHDLERLVWHGNAWNNGTVGIEINGLFEGVLGDPSSLWDDPSTKVKETGQRVTPEQIEATKQLVRWICSAIAKNGGSVNALVAHRQSSRDRRDDPGSEAWQEIALPLHAELGLTDGGVGFSLGGYAIPEAWDPRCKGIEY